MARLGMKLESLKGFFVCDKCRELCQDGADEVGLYGPNSCVFAYFPRKQRVACLGPYCDCPCALQKPDSDLTMDQLIRLVVYLARELNQQLLKDRK